jgi:hypothetical protein
MHVVLTLLACTPAVTPDDTEIVPVDTDVSVRPAPTLDADGVGAAFDAALSQHIPSFPPLAAAFTELMSHQQGTCPPDQHGFEILMGDGCHTDAGYVYSGTCNSASTWNDVSYAWALGADFVITDPDGNALEVGGGLLARFDVKPDVTVLTEDFGGTFRYPAGDAWLADGASGSALITATFPTDGPTAFAIQGGYDIGGQPVFFDGFTSDPVCATGGTIMLREESGYWYTIALACDSCGEVMWGDVSLGKTCVDMRNPLHIYESEALTWLDSHPREPE